MDLGPPGSDSTDNIGATDSNTCGAADYGSTIWYRVEGDGGQITVSTQGSAIDTVVAVYREDTPGVPGAFVACNDDDPSGGLHSLVEFQSDAGTSYLIEVGGFDAGSGPEEGSITIEATSTGPPTPPNDNFANAAPLTGSNASAGGTNVNATGEPGEPDHAGVSEPLASVWWNWTAPANGTVAINTCSSNYDTTLAAYTGNSVGTLTQRAADDDADAGPCADTDKSRIEFPVTAGTTYRIAVDGFGSDEGAIALSLNFTPSDGGGDGGGGGGGGGGTGGGGGGGTVVVTPAADADGDGFTPDRGDCDDGNRAINPSAFEVPGNFVDENCDSNTPPAGLSPSPTVRMPNTAFRRRTLVRTLIVSNVANGYLIVVRCRGRGCPVRRARRTATSGRAVSFRQFRNKNLRPGAVVEIVITRPGENRVGEHVSYAIRGGRVPRRRDRCVMPGSSRPVQCPTA